MPRPKSGTNIRFQSPLAAFILQSALKGFIEANKSNKDTTSIIPMETIKQEAVKCLKDVENHLSGNE